jgi:hypothetical protein
MDKNSTNARWNATGAEQWSIKDTKGTTDHILEHLEEKYIFGSLIYNALNDAGYRPEVYMATGKTGFPASTLDFRGKVIVKSVRRYLKKMLDLPM